MSDADLIKSLNADEQSINVLAGVLGYEVGKNPVDPDSDWRILFTPKAPDRSKGVIALKCVDSLEETSRTVEVRRLYSQVDDLKQELSTNFDVLIVGFVGHQRVVFFPYMNGNRDMRLDLSSETIGMEMYASNFKLMSNSNLNVVSDEFGFGDYTLSLDIQQIFKRTLNNSFLLMVQFYRKKLAELITSTDLKQSLSSLLSPNARAFLVRNDLAGLVQQESYTAVLSVVVDTIILRQLMRRFLEGYYGTESFSVSGISLGVGSGTLDEAIKNAVDVAIKTSDDATIKKLNQKKRSLQQSQQMDIFTGLFDGDELSATSKLKPLNDGQRENISELTKHAREQFETVYAGDLFSGSVGKVATKVEQNMSEKYGDFVAKMWIDTSSDQYSFRYEDVPPESLEKQYENSMSQNVQITLNDEGRPVVFYGDDKQEQKQKGAYYTDQRLVDYIIKQTVEKEFLERYQALKQSISANKGDEDVEEKIKQLLSMTVVDLTCGGGSFLRGAFASLAGKHKLISGLNISKQLLAKYPMFARGNDGEMLWEEHLLKRVIYGVDIDYKAVTIASLTLALSSLQHRSSDNQLPRLIGKTLIHQNSLISTIPYGVREKAFAGLKREIRILRKDKLDGSSAFEPLRQKLQDKVAKYAEKTLGDQVNLLRAESLEINLPEIFFKEDGSLVPNGGFTCVVGNPPWEVWKPNSDEFYSQYDLKYLDLDNTKQKQKRQQELRSKIPSIVKRWDEYSRRVEAGSRFLLDPAAFKYQSWVVDGRKASGDLNLYKVSVERFYQCLQKDGHMGVLIPDNIATDLGSTGIRHLIFEHATVEEYLSFENRRGIFAAVHRSTRFAVLVLRREKPDLSSFKAFFYKQSLSSLEKDSDKMDYSMSDVYKNHELLSMVEPRSSSQLTFYHKMTDKFKSFGVSRPFKLGNDFHRTNDARYFTDDKSGDVYPLFEGKTIEQFKILYMPKEYATKEGVMKKVNPDQEEWRIVLRDVASSTNRRSAIATLLPPGAVTTNSLNVQKNPSSVSLYDRLFYVGVLNSYVVDFYLRLMIDKHVNQFFVRQLPLPLPSQVAGSDKIVSLSIGLLQSGHIYKDEYRKLSDLISVSSPNERNAGQAMAALNAIVAMVYGLTRNELIVVLESFETPKYKKEVQKESQQIIDEFDRLTKAGD